MLYQALALFTAYVTASNVLAWVPGLTLTNGILAYLGLWVGAGVVSLGALHGGEFVGQRLLRWPPFERLASSTIGGSRTTTAVCLMMFVPGWLALTGYAAHVFGLNPYLGALLVTMAWLVMHWALFLAILPFWLLAMAFLGKPVGEW